MNPRHLLNGTHRENEADKTVHGTKLIGERCPWAKLTEADVFAIRCAAGTQGEIAERFGISRPHVSEIKSMKSWAWL